MSLTTSVLRPDGANCVVKMDLKQVRREFYVIRAMAALRQGLAAGNIEWRIEPHWDGFSVIGEPGDPLIMPICEFRNAEDTLVAIKENFVSSDLIGDLSDADREWYSELVRIEREKLAARRGDQGVV
jgi:hypothetical protein